MNPIEEQIESVVDSILEDYRNGRDIDKLDPFQQPDKAVVIDMIGKLMRILYPGAAREKTYRIYNARHNLSMLIEDVMYNLNKQIAIALRYGKAEDEVELAKTREQSQQITLEFLRRIPKVREYLATDVEAVFDGDPAAESADEIIFAYPGLYAITIFRYAHILYELQVPVIPRIMTELAHSKTGIDINPGATIGKYFMIDHGTGIVIGETAEIGNNVTLYQGVTLGGTGKHTGKRHPTLGSGVMVGAGAKVLGPFKVGDRAKIASNAVVLEEVPSDATAVGVPARVVRIAGKKVTDDLDHVHIPDPVAQEFCRVEHRLHTLEKKLRRYEEAEAAKEAAKETAKETEFEQTKAEDGNAPSADA